MDEITDYLRSFSVSLRAANKAPRTVETYSLAVERFALFLADQGMPTRLADIERRHIQEHLAWLTEHRAAATAAQRYGSLRRFFGWAHEEGEIDANPMDGLKRPKVTEKPVPVVSDDDIRKLLDACNGPSFEDRRDTAIIRLFLDTGARLSEITQLTTEAVDLDRQQILTTVKGGRVRAMPFGNRCAQALDRYERARRRHRYASVPWLWLGPKGRLGPSGIYQMMRRRAKQAGIGHLHPHQLRHTFAHNWLSSGGSEGDLVRLLGWSDRQMLDRYGSSAAEGRATDAFRRSPLTDRL